MKVSSRKESIIITYPTPTAAEASSTYFITVNNQPVFVEKYNSISYVHFAFVGKVDIEITVIEKVNTYTISPKSFGIISHKNQDKISFSLTKPTKLILHQVNSLDEKLFIIADTIEDKPPQIGDSNVVNILNYDVDNSGENDATERIQQAINDVAYEQGILYFPPGLYKTQQLNLKSYMTLYLAGGAVLEATKDVNPSFGQGILHLKNVNKVKIMGRGVLQGNGSYWRTRGGWYSLIEMSNVNTVLVQDIVLRDAPVANIWIEYSQKITVYNIKILCVPNPYFDNTDGFDFWSSRNITIDNVIYKGTDDATSHGGDTTALIKNNENINIKNSIFDSNGAFNISEFTYQDLIYNINYENIDVIYTENLVGLFSVARANFDNIYFKNIRVENISISAENLHSKLLFEFKIMVGNWKDSLSPHNLVYIQNIYFYNLFIDDLGNYSFQGYDSQRDISNVNFDNFYIKNQLVTNIKDACFTFIPSDKDRRNYVQLKFSHSEPNIINIIATKMYAYPSGEAGEFIVTRTGDTSKNLVVKYSIRGTAKNGVDYRPIANFVTIPNGASEVLISIQPQEQERYQGLKTVFLSLENLPNSLEYMLGSNFHAVVNIIGQS